MGTRSKEYIQRFFKKSPQSGSYLYPNVVGYWKLLDFYREAMAAGYRVEPFSMIENGLRGFVAYSADYDCGRTSGPVSYEIYYAAYPAYGKKLEPDDVHIGLDEWNSFVAEHEGHKDFVITVDTKAYRVGMCFCKASEGISIVRRISIKEAILEEKMIDKIVNEIITED